MLILATIALSLVSCSKKEVVATTADLISSNLSTAVVSGLECAKADVVAADIKAKVDAAFKIQAQGNVVAATFCKTVVDIVLPQVIGVSLPKAWECKATVVEAKVTDLLKSKACDKL